MPNLDNRLIAVTKQIRSSTHADIGSDHGGLLLSLLKSGRVKFGIAIENKPQPYNNSIAALRDVAAEVRFGDGLEVLRQHEADSLSICGLGAESIVRILNAFPDRVPERVVVQPNLQPELVRDWGLRNGFHLLDEQIAWGHWPYIILAFRRADNSVGKTLAADKSVAADETVASDPAYENVDRRAALLFGPLILKRGEPRFVARLQEEQSYWSRFTRLEPGCVERLALIRQILKQRDSGPAERTSFHPIGRTQP